MTAAQDSGWGLDPVLLEVLACPAEHHAPLVLGAPGDPAAASLTCTECGRVFPIRDGIPVLLLDEATGGPVSGADS
ncbi:MAG: Trm112 family protein [Nakamurella sp.]